MFVQTRQILHEFCCYLARLKGSDGSLNWLQKRIAEAGVPLQPAFELQALSGGAYETPYSMKERIDEVDYDSDESYQI
jgi:hypothetical protein